ncbi:glycosyl hydrolase family 15 [Apiospora phragmitis]|uniref:Glycosyl hydrolase family 15 n=1 Tax=Apiospora phragmitis TaxID=2905665 RepID=A0ABR1TVD4_9PEZI
MSGASCNVLRQASQRAADYLPIENYGMIGNMRTCALVAIDGGIDFMCWKGIVVTAADAGRPPLTRPDFDSPSLFCRLLDKDKGGHFSIVPRDASSCTTKQQYLPSSGILQTRYIHEDGVVDLVDFFPRPRITAILSSKGYKQNVYRETEKVQEELKRWLVRRVECIRGRLALVVKPEDHQSKTVTFSSQSLKLQLDVTVDRGENESDVCPSVIFKKEARPGMAGEGVVVKILLTEGQAVSFILREDIAQHVTDHITTTIIDKQQNDTQSFCFSWLSKSTYKGGWREVILRSLIILKMLTYELTGAIVAAPTFSIPEDVGGGRNWDYRFSWVRDSSFTIYILLRLGFTEEADAYMEFMNQRFVHSLKPDGGLPIMFTIHGETDIPEIELDHLHGYEGSRPVRIGNGAAFHHQHDIYGELMDGIYLYNKYGKPITWDTWVSVRKMLDHVLTIKDDPDMSIWGVRNHKQNFVYSKIMMWVAFDRGLRLSEKRCLPCPSRQRWLEARDSLYEEIMEKGFLQPGYNKEMGCFIQSYENRTHIDSSILIAPLVFFIAPNDPRFVGTLERILLPPEKGGSNQHWSRLPLRYGAIRRRFFTDGKSWEKQTGVGGREGAFSMCTFWLVEAMTRASVYETKYLTCAVNLFENMLSFSNHLSMFSEEIARSGEQLGNTPQAFSHLALISAAFNFDRVREHKR